jgi:hypothetical protein
MKIFYGNKENFRSRDYTPWVLDFQDFRIIGCRIKGILLYKILDWEPSEYVILEAVALVRWLH